MQEKEWQPRLYVLDKDAWQQQVDVERLLCDVPAGVQEFENALVLPLRNFDLPEYPHAHYYEGGFLDKDNNIVAGAARKHTCFS